ncbi:MAG: ATP-dependent helicase HrpB [Gemmatimonadaceae bacterium]|nr:ATP-dependent helicase HrpB [Gemmatimonadaceae bacterium]
MRPNPLPIDDALPALRQALDARGAVVLVAPPGAGKTTRVPPALLSAPWRAGGRIVMLEPRRLAARAAARRIAAELGEAVGGLVGWRMRRDTKVSRDTVIEVVTEGILTRMVQDDPVLDGISAVIFDEFHERHLAADLGLALVRQTRELLRPELKVVVMSATLDAAAMATALGDAEGPAPVVESAGLSFPVETRWVAPRPQQRVEGHVAAVVRDALRERDGDALVFLPGAPEIHRVARALAEGPLPPGTEVLPLFGALDGDAQDRAIAPAPAGRRKVVLSTSIAETSLTIEGVRIVVDAGLARVPRYSPATGMTRLETIRVPRPSADQRRGRAGRVAPGICWRCWADYEEPALAAVTVPEIRDADLAGLALDLAVLGIHDPATLSWVDAPPAAAFADARQLLGRLGALDAAGALTAHGRAMSALGLHPRLSHLVLAGIAMGQGPLAADLAALLDDRDPIRRDDGPGRAPADIRLRLEALRRTGDAAHVSALRLRVDHDQLARLRETARAIRQSAGYRDAPRPRGGDADADIDAVGDLLALAYPDRIARRRSEQRGRYLLSSGGGVALPPDDPLADAEWLVVAETDGRREEATVYLAAPVDDAAIRTHHADLITTHRDVVWDDAAGRVTGRDVERLGALVLRERTLSPIPPALRVTALLGALRARGVARWPWPDGAQRLRERLAFAHQLEGGAWPDVADAALLATLDDWLAPFVGDARTFDELGRIPWADALRARVPWDVVRRLDTLAPTHLEVASGSRIAVDYSDPAQPVLAVRLQELFGQTDTPTVGEGRVPVLLHLLSPARRPVQVTRDLAGFWRTSYFDVRKDLRGRYPKHAWPDDPLAAPPTRRTLR